MASASKSHLPAETDWLCEGCGYTLNGLPEEGNCPECGKPIRESASNLRTAPPWERPDTGNALNRLLRTSLQVIFRPTRFYRSFATRGSRLLSSRFARIHWILVSLLLGVAAWIHLDWFLELGGSPRSGSSHVPWFAAIPLGLAVFLFLTGITRLAARLTTLEATYRGLRLPVGVVLRGLDYHAAHYVPVALATALTVVGYRLILSRSTSFADWGTTYLYTLSLEVVLAAVYLFKTYWIAMRNMMYANG